WAWAEKLSAIVARLLPGPSPTLVRAIQDEANDHTCQHLARLRGKIDPSRRSGCAAQTDWCEQVRSDALRRVGPCEYKTGCAARMRRRNQPAASNDSDLWR